jgi:hypothetical protein
MEHKDCVQIVRRRVFKIPYPEPVTHYLKKLKLVADLGIDNYHCVRYMRAPLGSASGPMRSTKDANIVYSTICSIIQSDRQLCLNTISDNQSHCTSESCQTKDLLFVTAHSASQKLVCCGACLPVWWTPASHCHVSNNMSRWPSDITSSTNDKIQ